MTKSRFNVVISHRMQSPECRVEDLRFLISRREGGPVRFLLLIL